MQCTACPNSFTAVLSLSRPGEDKKDTPNNVNVQVTPPTEPSTSQPVKEEEKKDLPEGNEVRLR